MDHRTCQSEAALSLLRNARGQVEAAMRMVESDRYCIDVSKQLLAAQAMLKKANVVVLKQHIDTCVKDAIRSGGGEEKVEEIALVLERYLGS